MRASVRRPRDRRDRQRADGGHGAREVEREGAQATHLRREVPVARRALLRRRRHEHRVHRVRPRREVAALDPPKPISWRRLAIVAGIIIVVAAIATSFARPCTCAAPWE